VRLGTTLLDYEDAGTAMPAPPSAPCWRQPVEIAVQSRRSELPSMT